MAKQPNPKVVTKKHLARMERERIQQRYLLIATVSILVVILLVVIFGWFDQTILKNTRPVARVGNAAISTSSFQTQVRYSRLQLIQQLQTFTSDPMYMQFFGQYIQQMQAQLQNPTQIGQTVLDQMIASEVIKQEAQKMGISVSEEELSGKLEEEFGFFENGTLTPTVTATPFSTSTLSPTQLALVPPTATATETPSVTATAADAATGQPKSTQAADTTATPVVAATAEGTAVPAGSPTPDYTATPEPTATPYTREGFEKRYDEVVKNFSNQIDYKEQDLRGLVRDQLLREKVMAEVTKDMKPVEDQVWARHILVATEEEAKQVRARLDAGEGFAALAAELSTDTSNKDQGGDLGWFNRENMVEAFSTAAFAMQVGEISQPVESSSGWHIIQVLGHEQARQLTAEQFEQAKQTAFQKWIEAKKTELKVETFDRWIDAVPTEPEVPPELLQQQS